MFFFCDSAATSLFSTLSLHDALPIYCFAGQLNQVWLNLLVNAAHAVKEGGEVGIKTRREGDSAVVCVSDTGCGIAPENLDRKSTRLNSSHRCISYAVFCLKKKKKQAT